MFLVAIVLPFEEWRRVAGWEMAISSRPDLSIHYKEYVIYRALMDCYDHAVHLLECFIPIACNSTFLATHAARCGVVVDCHANCKGAHRAIPQRKSSYWRSS
jgi:hypothetical protein